MTPFAVRTEFVDAARIHLRQCARLTQEYINVRLTLWSGAISHLIELMEVQRSALSLRFFQVRHRAFQGRNEVQTMLREALK